MKKHFFVLGFFLWAGVATAQGVGAGASGYKNVNNLKGLCTTDNKDESYFKEGVCKTLKEQLTYDKCTAPLLEKLRKKLLSQIPGQPAPPPGQKDFNTGGLSCSSRQGNSGFYDPKVLKNPTTFSTIVMQFFMAVAIAESNLDVFNNLQKGPGELINSGAKGGLMNLTLKQMDDPKYNKDGCGCKVTNSSEQVAWFWSLFLGEAAYAANFLAGPSPGPRDAHHSIQCGAYMALVEAEKDGTLYGGNKGGQGDNAPKGAAKIFASLQEFERPVSASRDPNDPDLAYNPTLNFVIKKVRTYCTRNLNENGSLNRAMDDDFDASGNLRDVTR